MESESLTFHNKSKLSYSSHYLLIGAGSCWFNRLPFVSCSVNNTHGVVSATVFLFLDLISQTVLLPLSFCFVSFCSGDLKCCKWVWSELEGIGLLPIRKAVPSSCFVPLKIPADFLWTLPEWFRGKMGPKEALCLRGDTSVSVYIKATTFCPTCWNCLVDRKLQCCAVTATQQLSPTLAFSCVNDFVVSFIQ